MKKRNDILEQVPQFAEEFYKRWINCFPESDHPADWERFYMFVSVLINKGKKERTRYWLEERLRADCKKLNAERILRFADVYEHILEYSKVWKGNQAKLLTLEELDNRYKKFKNDT